MSFSWNCKTTLVLSALAALLLAVFSADSASAGYPDRIIKIVVPFAPGGGTDVIARTLAQEMARDLGATIVIESLFAPARTPADIIDRLNKSAAMAVQSEAFTRLGVNEGLVMVARPPVELDRYFRSEEARWRKVIEDAGIKIE